MFFLSLRPRSNHGRDAHATKSSKNGNGKIDVAPQPASPLPISLPGYSIDDVTRMTVEAARAFFQKLRLGEEGTRNEVFSRA